MAEWYLDSDPVNGAFSTFDFDEGEDRVIVRRYWDSEAVKEVLERNHYDREHTTPRDPDMQRAARIPDMVIYEWLMKWGVRAWDKNHQKKVNELLSSNEFYKLRANKGRL